MIIAVSSQNKINVTEHAGRCCRFYIYKTDDNKVVDKELLELEKDQVFHGFNPSQPHPLDFIDVFITGSLGRGLVNRLAGKGIKAFATEESDPDTAVEKYLAGTLITKEAHSHHAHGHEH